MNLELTLSEKKLLEIMLYGLDRRYNRKGNILLFFLDDITFYEFEDSIEYILENCINVNRTFSDAIEFLSIWLKKSPQLLLEKLKNNQLKSFFDRTEYDREGDNWYFSSLLSLFVPVIKSKQATSSEIIDYLFSNFDFLSMPDTFIREVIGYGQLEHCTRQIPTMFQSSFLEKIAELSERADIGRSSRSYLSKLGYLTEQVEKAPICHSIQNRFFTPSEREKKTDDGEFNIECSLS